MLTGRETIATAFAETAHRHRALAAGHHRVGEGWHRTSWGDLAWLVRQLTLGLAEQGVARGDRLRVDGLAPVHRGSVGLAAACLGAAAVLDGDGTEPGDLDGLVAAGRKADEAAPDRSESLRDEVTPEEAALADGDLVFTGADVLWGATSLAAALDADADDRLVSTLPVDTPAGWVAGVLVPVVTAAATWFPESGIVATVTAARPTIVVCTDADAALLAESPTDDLGAVRAVLVVDGAAGARRLAARGVTGVSPAITFPGYAGLVTGDGGRPLPGVTVGIEDDGEVVVRSDAVAKSRCEGGWLRTGRKGTLDGDRLTLVDA